MRMQQSALAEKLGISEAYLSEILKGKKEALDIRRKIILAVCLETEGRG